MKRVLFALLLVLFSSFAFSDVGPSPSYYVSVLNAEDFSDYAFYYSGPIWPERLDPIEGEASIYKLNLPIKVYAVPIAEGAPVEGVSDISAYPVSDDVPINAGLNELTILSVDSVSKTVSIESKNSVPAGEDGEFLLIGIAFAVLALAVLVFIVFGKPR